MIILLIMINKQVNQDQYQMDQQLSIVEYIKNQYPRVVFSPFKFAYRRALGFVVSDSKLIVGFINKSGHLCKVADPIDLTKLDGGESLETMLRRIPQVEGFSEKDKERLLRYLGASQTTIPGRVHDQLVQQLKQHILQKEAEYKIFVDSQTNEVLVMKKRYEEELQKLKDDFREKDMQYGECRQKLLQEKDIIKENIQKFSDRVKEYVRHKDMKIAELAQMHSRLLDEKRIVDDQLAKMTLASNEQLSKMTNNQDLLSEYENKVQERESQVNKLAETVKELQIELDKVKEDLNQAELKAAALEGHRTRCRDKILNEKQQIIQGLQVYNEKWKEWLSKSTSGFEEEKRRLLQEAQMAQERLKDVIDTSTEDKKELAALKQNISDIQASMQRTIQDQLLQLSVKDAELQQQQRVLSESSSDMSLLQEKDNEILRLKQQLEEMSKLLEQNRNTKVEPVVDYNKCSFMVQQYVAMHNTFARKQRILDIIGDIIASGSRSFSQLDPNAQESIRVSFEQLKVSITKHIDMFDFKSFMESEDFKRIQNETMRNSVSKEFCDSLANKLFQWEDSKLKYCEQDRQLTNMYEDLSGAVRVYIRLKPRGDRNEKGSANIATVEEKKIKSLDVECNGEQARYTDFYGIFDENYNNIDVYTGNENTQPGNGSLQVDIDAINESNETVSPGLYSVFKQVEDGYSIVLFGYGTSGSGKSYTLIGDDKSGVPGILHYGLANLKGVKNIRLKYLFEQYYRSVNPSILAVQGKICSLVGSLSGMSLFEVNESQPFSEYLGRTGVDVRNIKIEDLYPLTSAITDYRISKGRIKRTPNNKESSRSHLYMVFEIEFEPRDVQQRGKRGYVTIVDTAGRESPLDIMETFLDVADGATTIQEKEKLLNRTLLSLLSPAQSMGLKLVQDHKRRFGQVEENGMVIDLDEEYTPARIIDIVREGVYINETINHLIYYFKSKNHIVIRARDLVLQSANHYNKRNVFVRPHEEMERGPRKEVNCLMIPILQYLDSLSKLPGGGTTIQQYKPTKFITLVAVRQEARYCDQLLETLDFAHAIKSS
jgi:Kinesin motor domain